MIDPEIAITQGVDYSLTFSVATAPPPGGNPVDLTGATVKFAMKYSLNDDDDAAIAMRTVGNGVVLNSPVVGSAKIRIYASDTSPIQISGYRRVWCQAMSITSDGIVSKSALFTARIRQSAIKATT